MSSDMAKVSFHIIPMFIHLFTENIIRFTLRITLKAHGGQCMYHKWQHNLKIQTYTIDCWVGGIPINQCQEDVLLQSARIS